MGIYTENSFGWFSQFDSIPFTPLAAQIFEKRAGSMPAPFSVGELIASGSRRIQPLAAPCTTTLTIIVMVVIHLHVAAVRTTIGTTGAAGELDLLIQLDSFLDIDLFHSDFPFEVSISRNFLPVISYSVKDHKIRVLILAFSQICIKFQSN